MVVARKGKVQGTKFRIICYRYLGEIAERSFIREQVLWINTRGSVEGVPIDAKGPYDKNLTRPGCVPLPTDELGKYQIEELTERGWVRVSTIPYSKSVCGQPSKTQKTPKKKGKEKKKK